MPKAILLVYAKPSSLITNADTISTNDAIMSSISVFFCAAMRKYAYQNIKTIAGIAMLLAIKHL
jgi:hypothetical protein